MSAFEQAERLGTAGLKAAGRGVANLNAVEPNCHHFSADDVYRELVASRPTLSLSIVYGASSAPVGAGLVRKYSEFNGRLCVSRKTPHDHAICSMCMQFFGVGRALNRVSASSSESPGDLDAPDVLDARAEYDLACTKCKPIYIICKTG